MGQRRSFGSIGDSAGKVRLVIAVMVAVAGMGLALIAMPQPAGAQGCPGTVHKGVCFPTGDSSFADVTVLLDRGDIGNPPNGDASSPLGIPDDFTQEGGPPATPNSVSLGDLGVLIVQFTDNVLTGSGTPDADLWIFETGTATQLVDVAVSADGTNFTPVGSTASQNAGIDLDAFGFGPDSQLFFVRLQDRGSTGPSPGPIRGADIDAIGAISSVAQPATCNGLEATITGAGEIEGSSGHEVILGSAGDDVITGSSGHDTICGGGGTDFINGDSGNDVIIGNGTLLGDSGNDIIVGAGELLGDSGNDTITATDPSSTINGDSGTDSCTGTDQVIDCEG